MSPDQLARISYLVLLGAVVAFWFFVQNREKLGRKLQYAAVWALIFLGTVAAVGLWGDIRRDALSLQSVDASTGQIIVPVSSDGHYHLALEINGAPVRFVVDTGATDMVLSLDDARRAGIDPKSVAFWGRAMTANGAVRVAPVVLDTVTLGGVTDRDVAASVNEGDMSGSLLGMSYLQRFSGIEIRSGHMILTR